MIEKVDGFIISDGSFFKDEIDAYKQENKNLVDYIAKKEDIVSELAIIKEKFNLDTIIPIQDIHYGLFNPPKTSGIYLWINLIEGSPYIGSTYNLNARCKDFIKSSNSNYAGYKINEARKKYGVYANWGYSILEKCDVKSLEEREREYVSKYKCIEEGYNISRPFRIENKTCKINKEIIDNIASLTKDGLSVREISEKIGIPHATVNRWQHRLSLT